MLKDVAPAHAAAVSVLKRSGSLWLCPPWPGMRDDYYELLGIRSTATAKDGEKEREKEGELPEVSFTMRILRDSFGLSQGYDI